MKVELLLVNGSLNGIGSRKRTCSRTRSKSSQVVIQVFLAETQAINKNRKVERQQSSVQWWSSRNTHFVVGGALCTFTLDAKNRLRRFQHQSNHLQHPITTFFA